MKAELILFFISMLVSGVMVFILAKMYDSEIRDRRMKSFCSLGIVALGWILLNAATIIIDPKYFPFVYSAKMLFVIIVPYLSTWFFINFTESKLVNSRLIPFVLITIPALDILAMVTNPLHWFYFFSFDYPYVHKAPLFNIHIALLTIAVLFSYAIIFRYIVRNFRQYPILFLTGAGIIMPFVLNMLYSFNLIKFEHDVSPLSYFFTIIVFIYFSNISRLDTSKMLTQALVKITKSPALSSGIVEESAKIIVQEGCHALSTSSIRIGIWTIPEDKTVIKNITYYCLSTGKHSIQDDLDLSGCPEYLRLLKSERVILVNDAKTPNPLSPIMDSYGPNLCALLDAPIRIGGKLAGIVCIEQDRCREFPEKREWTIEEQNFASSLADFMTIAISSFERRTIMRRVEIMMSNLPGMVYQCLNDPPCFTFTFVSEGSLELTGYTPEELMGNYKQKFFEMVYPDDVESLKKLISLTLSVGLPIETTYRIMMKDGTIKWIWERSRVVEFNEDGTPRLLEGFYTDVTERKRLETAELANLRKLREAETKAREADERAQLMKVVAEKNSILTAILDATPDLIFFKDSDLRHTECNKALENHLNLRKSDISGKNDAEAFGFPPDIVEQYATYDKKVIAEKQIFIVEETIPSADGRAVLFETIKSPIIDDGKVIGLVGISRDITQRKATEESLNRQNSLLSTILNSASDPIFCIDLESRYTECNKSFENYFGVRKSDLIGKGNVEALGWSPEVTAQHTARDKKVFVEKQTLSAEELIPSVDGRVQVFETIKSPIIHDGEVTGLVGMGRDITQRKAAEENLNRQNSLMSTVNAAAAVLLEPETGEDLGAINRSMEMVCQSVDADRVYIWQIIRKEDGRLYYRKICKWIHAEKTVDNSFLEISYDDTIPYSKSLLLEGKSVNGPVDTLPKTDSEFLSSLDVQSILIVPLSFKGKLWGTVSFDDCHSRRFFPEADEYILRSWGLLVVGAIQRSEIMLDLEHAVAEAKKSSSEAEKAYAEAEAANRAKSTFLATMSHEIRTPMNAILGVTEIQLQNNELLQDTKDALNIVYNSGYTLLSIINDLLDLSKIEADKLELVNVRYETASLINDAVNLNVTRIGSKPIEFRLHVDEDIPFELIGDELRVKQIINNLLSNAFKYTDSGEVRLSLSAKITDGNADGGKDTEEGAPCVTLTVTVHDTGQGMTEEQVREMFDAYSRFNLTANRLIEGTGLGMSIVQHLVNKMGGDIAVDSAPGKGTEITVNLTQGYAGPARLGRELAENLMNFRLSNMAKVNKAQIVREPMPYGKVLVVDDMETNLYVAKGFLLPYGLSVDTALSGMEAIEKIEKGNGYDIVFMDHMMPEMDGIEAVGIMRGKGYTNPIVALTANAVMGQADMFMANGFDGFISKPIDIRELNASLNKFVRDRHPPEVAEAARAAHGEGDAIVGTAPQVNHELIKIFTRDAKKAIAVLQGYEERNSYGSDDLQMYIINVHGLKSVLANIGEAKLSGLARELEHAGRERRIDFISEKTSAFLSELRTAVDNLKPDAKEYGAGDVTEEDKAYLRKMLLTVKEACAAYDKKAAKAALTKLKQKPWPGAYGELLDTIAGHLLHSDFDEAEAACETYLSDKREVNENE